MIHFHSAGNDVREARGLLEDVCCFAGESLSGNPRSALSQPTPSRPAGEEEEEDEEEKREQRGKGEEESLAGMSYFFFLISLHLMHGLLNACLTGART